MIPASLGYGDKGKGPIPAGATIYFTMTLQVKKLWSDSNTFSSSALSGMVARSVASVLVVAVISSSERC